MSWYRGDSATDPAISAAAMQMGLPDPVLTAEEVMSTDVDALHEWFSVAEQTRLRVLRAVGVLSECPPLLAAAWSSPAPRVMVAAQRDAGSAAGEIIGAQLDAARGCEATLRQLRLVADGELAQAETAVRAMGWPPGEDLLLWSAAEGRLMAVSGLIAQLSARLEDVHARATDALRALALALRTDPGLAVQDLALRMPPSPTSAGSPSSTIAGPAGAPPGSAMPIDAIDQHNLDRLAADLHSTDIATVTMALGVQAALQQARVDGGVAQLLVYESANSSSEGRAAISVGDLTTAGNVATMAPGIGNAPVNMINGITSAANLRREAQQQASGESTAVIAWYGYDIPLSALGGVPVNMFSALANATSVVNDAHARDGGRLLANDLTTFRRWAPEHARFVAVGFSMGSTTASEAVAHGAPVDDVVLLGSPGAGSDVRTAADYPALTGEHTFVGSFDQDPVTGPQTDLLAGLVGGLVGGAGPFLPSASPFGPDPASRDFGAQVMDVRTNNPDISVELGPMGMGGPLPDLLGSALANQVVDLAEHHQEMNYLSGDALRAVAAVVVGHYSDVPVKAGR